MAAAEGAVCYGDWVRVCSATYGRIYLGCAQNDAVRAYDVQRAVALQVRPAGPAEAADGPLAPGETFVLQAADKRYLQRTRRITAEAPHEEPHRSCRFAVGFAEAPTQWLRVQATHCEPPGRAAVAYASPIGITIAGAESDPTSPDTDITRLLTLRPHDEPNVVVHWWASDERLLLEPVPVGDEAVKLDALRALAAPAVAAERALANAHKKKPSRLS